MNVKLGDITNAMVKILLLIALAREMSAVGFNDCLKDDRKDNKIRIGFLSRYKSSKVSQKIWTCLNVSTLLSNFEDLCEDLITWRLETHLFMRIHIETELSLGRNKIFISLFNNSNS